MALPFPTMADAVSGAVASSNEYNKLIDNIIWLGGGVDANTTLLSTVDSRTTNTSGTVGIGNQRLSDRLGAGVTTANTAAAQLAALQNPDACYAYQNTDQAIASGTAITLDAELLDTNSMHSTVTNNSRITIQKSGIYIVSGMVGLVGGGLAASRRIGWISKNGTPINGMIGNIPPTPNPTWNLAVTVPTAPVSLAAGDYLELFGYWGAEDTVITGTNRRTVTGQYASFMSAVYLRP